MQNKKKEKYFGDKLGSVGRGMASKFLGCIEEEFEGEDPFPIQVILKYRPGDKYHWNDDPVISLVTKGDNTQIFEHLGGVDLRVYDEDEDGDEE